LFILQPEKSDATSLISLRKKKKIRAVLITLFTLQAPISRFFSVIAFFR